MAEVCNRCNEEITSRIITALGKKWHPEHFTCLECNAPIVEKSFHQKDGQPVCTNCYTYKYCAVCAGCNKPIQGKVVTAMNQSWHEDHFVCAGPCAQPLNGQSFYNRDNKPFCAGCFEQKFASRCGGCGNAIVGSASVALDQKWHPECFKCKECGKPITEESFGVENNQPVCTKCY